MNPGYSRASERLYVIGSCLFGAIVGFALGAALLLLLVIVLYPIGFLFLFPTPIFTCIGAVRCAESGRRQFVEGRLPWMAVLGYMLAGSGLLWALRTTATPIPDEGGGPVAISSFLFVMIHAGALCGAIVAQEVLLRRRPGAFSRPYPLWGYVAGGVGAMLYLAAFGPLVPGMTWMGVAGFLGGMLLLVALIAGLIAVGVSPFVSEVVPEGAGPPAGAPRASSGVKLALFIVIAWLLSLGFFICIAVK